MRSIFAIILMFFANVQVANTQVGNLFSGATTAASTTGWATLAIGAGGWVTGIDIASDGTKVARTDTWGGYWWNGSRWAQCVTTASMPAADVGFDNTTGDPKTTPQGVYEIVVAPSNTSRFYMMFNGRVYITNDHCTTWTRTAFAQVTTRIDPNDTSYKAFGKKIAVDPNNADVVYVGTGGDGLFVSADAGSSWSSVSGVAASTTANVGSILVAFDSSSSIVGGKTQTLYASSYGHGVYVSTNGGTSWTLTTGTQTTHSHLFVSAGGIVYLTVNVSSDGPYKYASGSWSHLTGTGDTTTYQTIAVDPSNASRIIIADDGGRINQSTNGGSTWTGPYFYGFPDCSGCITSTDVPWLASWTTGVGSTYNGYLSNGNMQFDPSVSNTLYVSHGTGVFYGNLPSTYSAYNWIDRSIGIEQLVGNNVVVPPGSRPSVYAWDRAIFYSSALATYPTDYNPSYADAINMGWSADWSPQTNSTLVCLCNWFGPIDHSAKSTNSGQTWSTFATTPSLTGGGGVTIGGSISAASDSHYLIVQNNGNSAGVFYTSNSGSTWSESTVGTIPISTGGSDTGWGFSYSLNRRVGVCDKVTQDLCWLYNPGLMGDASKAGIYKSTAWPPSWTRVFSGVMTTYSDGVFNVQLRSVPGKTGHLFYTGGGSTGSGAIGSTQDLKRSSDSGTTWNSVPNIKNVYAIGFGKETNGGLYPSIYIAGFVTFNGGSTYAWGIYRSTNGDQATPTWTLLSNYPLNSFDTVTWIEGDMSAYGNVYVAFRGSGYGYGYFP